LDPCESYMTVRCCAATQIETDRADAFAVGLLSSCCCREGVFHSEVEMAGMEFTFGPHYDETEGVYDKVPNHQQRGELQRQISQSKGAL
jgi:hypothetical protein